MTTILELDDGISGIKAGSNPNQSHTDQEMETIITSIRLVNVGNFDEAKDAIFKAKLSDHQRDWLRKELWMVSEMLV